MCPPSHAFYFVTGADVHFSGSWRRRGLPLYPGAGPNVCHTALDSAKQNSVTAYATGRFSTPPCKGGVTNIRACTCVQNPQTLVGFRIRTKAGSFALSSFLGCLFSTWKYITLSPTITATNLSCTGQLVPSKWR
jgi:hypothetical protein